MSKFETESFEVISQTVKDDDSEYANCTLMKYSDAELGIWLETEDGDCSHSFTRDQFDIMVNNARQLMGWL